MGAKTRQELKGFMAFVILFGALQIAFCNVDASSTTMTESHQLLAERTQ
jgi:hypothetical protein